MTDDKEKLAKRVEAIDPGVAQIIRAEDTKLDRIPASFIKNGSIFRIEKFANTRPIILYFGVVDPDFTAILSGNPNVFFQFAKAAGTNLDSSTQRAEYVRAFLETTKTSDDRLIVLNSVDEIKPRPNLDTEKVKQFEAFKEQFGTVIKPPKCSDTQSGSCVVFVIHGQDLLKYEVGFDPDGKLNINETVLAKDLLIPYAL